MPIVPPRLHGQASWPGVLTVSAFNGTLSHGVQSGVYTLSIAPQPGVLPAANGALTITDGANAVVFPGCRLDSLVQVRADSYLWQLQILDRRWKWRFGSISGTYNVRDDADQIYPAMLRSVPELATLCLKAMGETNFDVSILPAAEWPSVDWINENPAVVLNQLVETYGCRVVYRPSLNGSQDGVVICRLGVGADVPAGPIVNSSPGIDSPETPSALLFVGGPTRFESMFILEAVGEDIDGEIKLIDELSYTPDVGWEHSSPPNFPNLRQPIIDPLVDYYGDDDELMQACREACERSVFRYYRVKWTGLDDFGQPLTIPEHGQVDYRWQLLLESTLTQQVIRPDGQRIDRPAEVYGNAFQFSQTRIDPDRDQFGNTANFRKLDVQFTIDPVRMIVIFSEPLYMNLGGSGTSSNVAPADLRLLCSCQVRDPETNQVVRYERLEKLNSGVSTPPEVVSRPQIQAKYRGEYAIENFIESDESGRWVLRSVADNLSDVELEVTNALDAAKVQYLVAASNDVTYAGILPIPLDGALRQITWSFSTQSPPATQLSRNTEHAFWLPGYEESRRVALTRPRRAPAGVEMAADGIGRFVPGRLVTLPQRLGALYREVEAELAAGK